MRLLQKRAGIVVHGTARRPFIVEGLHSCHQCDFRKPAEIHQVISSVEPDVVLHLAASSDPSNPDSLLQTNVAGAWHLLEACKHLDREIDVMLVGSAASFGEMRPDETGLGGDRICEPGSLYGVSRQTQMEMGRIADGESGLKVFLCRTFNLIGPGISNRYVPQALATRIADAIQSGLNELELRDLDAVRDFIDVRDAVAAYFAILEQGRTGYAYSVGRSEPVKIKQLARLLAEKQGAAIDFTAPAMTSGPSRSGIKRSVADSSDLEKETGWSPQFTLNESLRDMLAGGAAS